ncbi:MAG: hypothetical protein WCH75_13120 [Candidatus Binatia bacterium]
MAAHLMFCLVFAMAAFIGLPVWGDIAPPPNYVEKCTVSAQRKSGEECRLCSAWHGGRQECDALAAQRFVKRCQTQGASTWGEVWCRLAPKAGDGVPRSFSGGDLDGIVAGTFLTLAFVFGGLWVAPKISKTSLASGPERNVNAHGSESGDTSHATPKTKPGKQNESDSCTG